MPYELRDSYYSPYGPVATFLTQGVQPPAAQYIGPSDQIQLTLRSPNVGATVTLGLRLLSLKGEVQPLSYTFTTPPTAGGSFIEVITPGECFLLSAVITNATVRRGQCWATVNLQRGNPTGGAAVGMVLIAGYATATDTLGYPGTPSTDSLSGRGASLVYTAAPVAPVTDMVITVPPATRWSHLSATGTALWKAGANFDQVPVFILATAAGAIKCIAFSQAFFFESVSVVPLIQSSNESGGTGIGGSTDANAGDTITFTSHTGYVAGSQLVAFSLAVEEHVEI